MRVDYETDWSGHHTGQINGITPDSTIAAYGKSVYTRVAPGIFSYIAPSNKILIMALAIIDSYGRHCLIGIPTQENHFYVGAHYATEIINHKVKKYTIVKENIGSLVHSFEVQSTLLANVIVE